MRRTSRAKGQLVLGTGIIVFGAISGCASSSSRAAVSTTSAAQASSANPASPGVTFSDGTRVELSGSSGGTGSINVGLKVTAGRSGLDLRNAAVLRIHPVDDGGNNPWSDAWTPEYDPPVNPEDMLSTPPDLQPGQSVCIQQTFSDMENQQEPYADLAGWEVTIAQSGGVPESATLNINDDVDVNCGA